MRSVMELWRVLVGRNYNEFRGAPVYRDNGKENGNHYGILGIYRDNGKENGNYYKDCLSFWAGLTHISFHVQFVMFDLKASAASGFSRCAAAGRTVFVPCWLLSQAVPCRVFLCQLRSGPCWQTMADLDLAS